MSDVRELLARLNPTTIRMDLGIGGGVDVLTNIDVAGALGMVPSGLGRELLEACWWPDGAALRRHKLRDSVIALVAPELRRQQRRLAEARTDLGLAEVCIGWAGAATAEQRLAKERAQTRLSAIKAQSWPITTLESLPTLAQAAIQEIATRPFCVACRGRGSSAPNEPCEPCALCLGSGVGATSDRRRAAAIGRDEAGYRRTWKPVYEWLLMRMQEAEIEAAKRLQAALGGRPRGR